MYAGNVSQAGPGVATATPGLDFETASDAGYDWDPVKGKWCSLPGIDQTKRGLSVVGSRNYVEHPSFRVLSLAYNLLDGQGTHKWVPGQEPPYDLLDHVRTGGRLSGWNIGSFEWYVWNIYCVREFMWPYLSLENLYCTMAKARASAYPGALKDAGAVMQLVNQKDKDGDRLLKKFSMPRQPTKGDPRVRILPEDDPEDFQRLLAYNVRDVDAEQEASMRAPDLSLFERDVWLTDQRVNHRGLGVDVQAVEDCIVIIQQATEKYNAELRAITNGHVSAATELAKLTAWCNTQGVNLYSLDAENLELALKWDLPRGVRRALEIRQMLSSASVKKLFSLRAQQCGGRLYDWASYHAARTGRWTGNGPQPHNFPKGEEWSIEQVEEALAIIRHRTLELVEYQYGLDNAVQVIVNCLRGLLIAGPGYELVASDYSAIEGVVTAALAGEEWRLEVFRTHGKIYELSVSKITGTPFEEIVAHKERTGKHHPLRQTVGKVAELASGFGGWIGAWKRFGAEEFFTDEEMKAAILAWRRASPMIVNLWGGQSVGDWDAARPMLHGLEGAAVAAVMNPGQAFDYRGLAFQTNGDVLYGRLPSGRILTYHEPRLQPTSRDYRPRWELELSYTGWNSNPQQGPMGWVSMNLYGGKLTENFVQAAARDIQAHALVNIERAGHRPVLHSHDEIVGEAPEGMANLAEFERLMSTLPAWAAGWPVKAKGGWVGKRYRK